jgi:O-succinylbenzoate synthase
LTLTVNHVRLPFLFPFTTSFGTETERDALILRLDTGGVTAFGECVTSTGPFYSYEDNVTSFHMIKDHLVRMIKDEPTPEEFMQRSEHIRGHNMAKAAVEMLLWDYQAKLAGRPVVQSLGPSKGHADVGISLGMDKPEVTIDRVRKALERGYQRVKLKIERGKEFQIVKSVRDAFPEIPLSADANSCYTMKDLAALKKLDRFGLVYLEQPLEHDDLFDHARLAKELSTPICLDESISTVERAWQALEIGACQVINIKPGRVGGFTNSLKVAKLTRKHGGHVWVGGMLETGIGRAFNVSFASLRLVDYPGDTSPNDKYFARDLVKNPFSMTKGRIKPNPGPGIGVDVDEEFFARSTVKSWKLL